MPVVSQQLLQCAPTPLVNIDLNIQVPSQRAGEQAYQRTGYRKLRQREREIDTIRVIRTIIAARNPTNSGYRANTRVLAPNCSDFGLNFYVRICWQAVPHSLFCGSIHTLERITIRKRSTTCNLPHSNRDIMDVLQYGPIEYNSDLAANDTESPLFLQVEAFLWSGKYSKGVSEAKKKNIEEHLR